MSQPYRWTREAWAQLIGTNLELIEGAEIRRPPERDRCREVRLCKPEDWVLMVFDLKA